MKFLDKLGLVLFSTIIMILAIITCFVVAGWLDIQMVINIMKYVVANSVPTKITLILSVILGLFAVRCVFFNSFAKDEEKGRDSILLENENGKLLVSKDTIENLTNSVAKNFEEADNIITKVNFDEENGVSIYITLFVKPNTVIKDLANKLQTQVKETIKNSIDLDIKSVNIRIKDIAVKKEETPKQQTEQSNK